MRIRGRTAHPLVVGLVVLTLAAGACSDNGDDGGSANDTSGASGSEINRSGVVGVGTDLVNEGAAEGFSIDPAEQTSFFNGPIQYLIFGRLMRPTPDGGLEPDLAERVTVVDDSTIDIDLRDGLTWHDGTPFDAESVKAGLERSLASDNRAGLTDPFFALRSIEETSPTSLTLTIGDGTAASWHDTFLGGFQTTIVKPGEDFTRPIGAGPMRVVEYSPEESIVLERYEDFWNADAVNFAGMEIIHTASTTPQAGAAALRAGQVDIVSTVPDQIPAFTGALDVISQADPSRVVNMPICKREGPYADARVRQALNKAIDREALNEALFAGTGVPATEVWPEGHRFHTEEVADTLAYDPDAARDLLAEAGYADGVTIEVYPLGSLNLPAVAAAIQSQWAEVGITANINPTPDYVSDFLEPHDPPPVQAAMTATTSTRSRSLAPGQA